MTGAHPQTMPATLVIGAGVTTHRHEEADQTIDWVTVNPMEMAVAPRTTLKREGRVMKQPPAYAQRNRHQRAEDQYVAYGVGKGDLRQKIDNPRTHMSDSVVRARDEPPEPRAGRAPQMQPLKNQKDAESDDHQPDDLKPVGPQNLAEPALMMMPATLGCTHGFFTLQRCSPLVQIYRRANSRALVDAVAQA